MRKPREGLLMTDYENVGLCVEVMEKVEADKLSSNYSNHH